MLQLAAHDTASPTPDLQSHIAASAGATALCTMATPSTPTVRRCEYRKRRSRYCRSSAWTAGTFWTRSRPMPTRSSSTGPERSTDSAAGTVTICARCCPSQNGSSPCPPWSKWLTRSACRTIDCPGRPLPRSGDMDFASSTITSRQLLNIGYDLGERRRDPSWYDMLASEARLTSYLLIAQGQVPQKHWFALGRLLTSRGGDLSLMSWSGSMFEYLMPLLFLPSYENTLLDQACRAAIARQIDYAHQRHVPWGISESCYNAVDMNQVYQYRAFGVPGLGFKTGLADDLVIAPYASALALTVVPREACRNLQALSNAGLSGRLRHVRSRRLHTVPAASGLRPRCGSQLHGAPPRHELLGDRPRTARTGPPSAGSPPTRRCRRPTCCCRSAYPSRPSPSCHAPPRWKRGGPRPTEAAAVQRVMTDPDTPLPEVHLLSNGNYHVMATQAGGGYSRWRDLAVTRWREDATCDNYGTFIYLRDPGHRAVLVHRLPADAQASPTATRRSLSRHAPSTADATTRSIHTPRSASLPRTTSRSAASPSPTISDSDARDRGHQLCRSGHGTLGCRPCPSCVQQPLRIHRDTARAQGHTLPTGVLAHRAKRPPGCCTCCRCPDSLEHPTSYETDRARVLGPRQNGRGSGRDGDRPVQHRRVRCSTR